MLVSVVAPAGNANMAPDPRARDESASVDFDGTDSANSAGLCIFQDVDANR